METPAPTQSPRKTLANRLREIARQAQSKSSSSILAQLFVALASLMVGVAGIASIRAVVIATLERHVALSLITTVIAVVSGALISGITKWKRDRHERRGHRLASEIKQAYRQAIGSTDLARGKAS
jgi:hypothetical protein